MKEDDSNDSNAFLDRLMQDTDLLHEYKSKYGDPKRRAPFRTRTLVQPGLEESREGMDRDLETAEPEQTEESIIAHFRPVMIIRDNQIVPEFVGREVEVWKNRLMEKADVLNSVIPSVGRIEVNNNALYNWVGTGWLVDTDVVVTNRHVASTFCQNKTGFSFKVGYPQGYQSAKLDFLKEDQRSTSLEFDVDAVLWMSENNYVDPDIAFLRVKRATNGPLLPKPIPLAKTVEGGEIVVTIGYPARDPEFPDQKRVLSVFKNVYGKKRLAPGEVKNVGDTKLEHDCSTLLGNSGSAVIKLATGEALGLHFAGIYKQANYAVPAAKIGDLLDQLKNKKLPGMRTEEISGVGGTKPQVSNDMTANRSGTSVEFNIRVKITVEEGGTIVAGVAQVLMPNAAVLDIAGNFEQALSAARQYVKDWPEVRNIRRGYRFRNGWITDEQVIVVEVTGKKSISDLRASNRAAIPAEFFGIGVDVRSADFIEQLMDEDVNIKGIEAAPQAGYYREPPRLKLNRVKAKMKAIFHVSPDSAYPNLREFIKRIDKKLTATMYQWDGGNHISDALVKAITQRNGKLKMITQRAGTREAVQDMKSRLKTEFDHVWASVGKGNLIPSHYHMKVATRDRKEFWLSSGNWKDSNQADIDPAGEDSTAMSPYKDHNREWNVIIENAELAGLFEDYINWDFNEAKRVPIDEAVEPEPIYLFVPDDISEHRRVAKYFDPLRVTDRDLDIQPLLTPDRDSSGRRMFIKFATDLIQSAKSAIYIQNQSFTLLDDNVEAFERFFIVLKKKQQEGLKTQVIFRDLEEFRNSNMKLIERLKDFGVNTGEEYIRVQRRCHTKAIIVDPEDDDKAAVLFGSHNLTNSGALYNRDASLLIRDAEVTRYFKQIFDYDWENLARPYIEDSPRTIRKANVNETPPPGFRKISLDSLLVNM